jgi:hypothetical protein
MSKHRKVGPICTMVLAVAACRIVAWAAVQDPVGYVIEITGPWAVKPGSAELALGGPVLEGQYLQPQGPRISHITIAFLDGTARTYREAGPVKSLQAPPEAALVDRIKAVAKAVHQNRLPAIFSISRGRTQIRPAVLKRAGRRLDLAPAFGSMEAGHYNLELARVEGGEAIKATCNFDLPADTSATVPDLAGVYTLQVSSDAGTLLGSVMVLIVGPEDFEAKSAAFQKGVEMTAAWPADTDSGAIQLFLGALLLDLAGPALP